MQVTVARLLVGATDAVSADRMRALDDDVSVTVGSLDGVGFYVEDDGPGIPAGEREAVLESGFTTHVDGTGLGLAIVAEVAAAHGWDLAVTTGTAGGARFEFRFQPAEG